MAFDTPPSSLEFPTTLLEEGMNNYFPAGTMHSYNNWDNWVIPISISGSEKDYHSEFSFSRTQLNEPNYVTVAKYERQFERQFVKMATSPKYILKLIASKN